MTRRRVIWFRYWLVVNWVAACVGGTVGASVAILTTASTGTVVTIGGVAGLLVLCLGIYGTASVRQAINQETRQ